MSKTKIYQQLVLACLLPLCIYGCSARSAFGLASVEEEGLMLSQEVDDSMRLAVIVSQENTVYEVPAFGFGEDIAAEVVLLSRQFFGTESIAMDHSEGSDWVQELKRAEKLQSDWKSTRGEHDDFYRTQGFDIYFEVVTYPQKPVIGTPMPSIGETAYKRQLSDQMKDTLALSESMNNSKSTDNITAHQQIYKPVYRIFKVQPSGEVKRLAVDWAKTEIVCSRLAEPGECAHRFGQSIKNMLEKRLPAVDK